MKKLFLIIPLFFISCIDKRGITLKYYPECKEEYNLYGEYRVECENNILNWKDCPCNKEKICLGCK